MRHLLLPVLMLGALVAGAAGDRDLAVYTTSTADGVRITAVTRFVNRGMAPLRLAARLRAHRALGFPGAHCTAEIAPGAEAAWAWRFTAPPRLQREVLAGEIRLGGQTERELYIAVQGPEEAPPLPAAARQMTAFGPDLATFPDDPAERITVAAQVTGTYAPRTQASIDRERAARETPPPTLTLAQRGTSDYTIVVGAAERQALAEALDDLQRCLNIQSGAALPVAAAAAGPAIRLALAQVDAPGRQDAYRLRTVGTDVLIEAATPDGLRNGIYGLLTDHLGCRWFMPGALGEEIPLPKDRAVRLPALDETRGSPWFSAGGACWGADRRWDRRNRALINDGRMHFGHAWYSYVNAQRYPYAQFPDYYARDRQGHIRQNDQGWTWTNLCTTSPEVIAIVAQQVNAYFDAHPEALVASLEPNDYGLMCQCDRCLALDKQYGQTREEADQVADRLLHFSQQIYDRLDPQYRDKYLGILIYGNQDALPVRATPHPHHAGIICHFMLHYDHSRPWTDPTSPRNVEFSRRAAGWGRLLTQYGYYDYYGHWAFFGPWAMVHKLREDLPAFRALGGTFLVLENQPNFAAQGLNHYVAARLIWDLDADVDLLADDFYRTFYGPVAAPMRRYWQTAERYYALERPGIMPDVRVAARPAFWTELAACLQEAVRLTAALPPAQHRFRDRVQFAADGLAFGRILYQHDARFGQLARRAGLAIDHAAAVAFLQAHQAELDAIQARYPADSPYWPPLVARYFRVNVAQLIKSHTEAIR